MIWIGIGVGLCVGFLFAVLLRAFGDPRTARTDRALLKRIAEEHRELGIGA